MTDWMWERLGGMPRKLPHPIGQQYGKVTVLAAAETHVTPSGKKFDMVRCMCSCGAETTVFVYDLRSGKTKSCGRGECQRGADHSLPAFNNIYRNSYRGRALKSGLVFDITEDQFREISQQHCHYCGRPPSGVSYRAGNGRGVTKSGKYLSQFIYNGMDRLNSAEGYTVDNVVPCCGTCNHAKHTMPYDVFMAWIHDIVAFHTK